MKLYYKINDGDWQEYQMSVAITETITINSATATTQGTSVVTHDYDGVYSVVYGRYGSVYYEKDGIELYSDFGKPFPKIGDSVNGYFYSEETGNYTNIDAEVADITGKGGPDTLELNVNAGDKIQLKCDQRNLDEESVSDGMYAQFDWETDFNFNAGGNPKSFMHGEDYIYDDYCGLYGFFDRKKVVDASEVVLSPNADFDDMFRDCELLTAAPSFAHFTKEAPKCSEMFAGCTSLVNAPALPSTILTKECYRAMFAGCTSLVNAPALPATKLAIECYTGMFADCTSLVNAPALPATKLPQYCYSRMFSSCTSLVETPWINVSEFGDKEHSYEKGMNCDSMFSECTSLTTIHLNITAKEIDGGSFSNMFSNCTSLTSINFPLASNATKFGSSSFSGMFSGCTELVDASITIGNAGTLTDGDTYHGACDNMFNGCVKLEIPPVLLPMNIGAGCCIRMFKGCTSLVTAPNLPATSVSESSYNYMFEGCTALTNVQQVLPAMDLGKTGSSSSYGCYQGMFAGCTSLVTAPELPAETLPFCAYGYMFSGCTALVNAPSVLPATTIGEPYAGWSSSAYGYMFVGCTSLQRAPVIMAQTLPKYAAKYMFSGCTSLNYIKCLATSHDTGSSTNSTLNWVSGVASTGTFVKHPSASWSVGVNGRPSGWTVQNESQ